MIIRLMPLPMPNSSICSPSHIRNIVPAVIVSTATICQYQMHVAAGVQKRRSHEVLRLDVRLDVEPALEQAEEQRWRSACIR